MSPDRPTRRSFLTATTAALASGIAGCAAVEPPGQPVGGSPNTVDSRSADVDRFVALYEAVREAVVELRIDIPDDPTGGGGGSGFFIDSRTIVTNAHVVRDRDIVEIRYADNSWEEGTVLGTDTHSDLAIVQSPVDAPDSTALAFVDEFPRVGEEVMAIGSPLGFSASASTGIVSGVNRSLGTGMGFSIPAALQTDAAVNPGNSGGPLVNLDGSVLGVVFAGAGDNIGFAISAPLANRVLPVLQEGETFEHSYMGVQVGDVTPRIATANDLPEPTGVYIDQIAPNGPSDGVLEGSTDQEVIDGQSVPIGGDIIVSIDGTDIPHLNAFSMYLALETDPGDVIAIELFRDGERMPVDLELGSRPETAG